MGHGRQAKDPTQHLCDYSLRIAIRPKRCIFDSDRYSLLNLHRAPGLRWIGERHQCDRTQVAP